MFTSDFFSTNRTQLRKRCDNENPIVITASGLVQQGGDSAYPFKQDANFWYLTGVEEPEVILVVTNNEEFLILPERDVRRDVFDGAVDTKAIQKISGIATILPYQDGWERLRILAESHKTFNAPLHKSYDADHNIFTNPAKARLLRNLRKLDVELEDIRLQLAHMRMIKQQPEIDAIQKAIDITLESITDVFSKDWAKRYTNEREIDADIQAGFIRLGGRPAYQSIVAGGKCACTLHYINNNQPLQNNELVLIDVGAEHTNYVADISRTYAPGKMTTKQQRVYEAVKEAQIVGFEAMKPGVSARDVQKAVVEHIGAFLKAEKLITEIRPEEVGKYFPHAFGHHLGLDVHDVADYSEPLTEGMVLTMEPGIYIPEWSVGVRLEDDVLITKTGAQVLSAGLPS